MHTSIFTTSVVIHFIEHTRKLYARSEYVNFTFFHAVTIAGKAKLIHSMFVRKNQYLFTFRIITTEYILLLPTGL